MRVAILLTSNDTSDFAKRHSTDDIKYIDMIAPLRPAWQLESFAVWQDEFPEDINAYDGFILTGSPASVHDDEGWIRKLLDLIRNLHAKKIPMFGGCFGHQAIALALGGQVEYNLKGGWSIGRELTRYASDAPYGLAGHDLAIYSVHKEEVTALPAEARAIGRNDYCKYPAFVMGDYIMTSQYHPEMTEVFLVDLTSKLSGIVPDDQLAKARGDFQSGHEGEALIRAVIRFFEKATDKP